MTSQVAFSRVSRVMFSRVIFSQMIFCLIFLQFFSFTIQNSQFHLSFDSNNLHSRHIDWITSRDTIESIFYYGFDLGQPLNNQIKGIFVGTLWTGIEYINCWTVRIIGLHVGMKIFYSLNQNDTNPLSFNIFNPYEAKIAFFGDLGSLSQGNAAGISIPALSRDAQRGFFHALFHLGDISYNFHGQTGNNFMKEISPIASKVPYMPAIGNHEYETFLNGSLRNYEVRFEGTLLGAGMSSGTNSSRYYSLNVGLMHIIIIDTEIYGGEDYVRKTSDQRWIKDNSARILAAKIQKEWLERDLSVVNRAITPYVILGGHRPPFQAPTTLQEHTEFFKDIVPLIQKYGVDLYICGHAHAYYSLAPSMIENYQLPNILIVGSAGNNEFIRDRSEINTTGFTILKNYQDYGYGYLSANLSFLQWEWGFTTTDGGHSPKSIDWTLADSLVISNRYLSQILGT